METEKEKQTYVHDGVEIKLTGREARKESRRRTTRGTIPRVEILVEITPVDVESGTWKKWVKKEELYEISK